MKRIEALLKGRKFTERLFGLRKRSIYRALDSISNKAEAAKEKASMDYEQLLVSLADDDVDFDEVASSLIEAKENLSDAEWTIKAINEIKSDLDSEVNDKYALWDNEKD